MCSRRPDWSRRGAKAVTSSTTSRRRRCARSAGAGRSIAGGIDMRIVVTSVMVDDQEKALRFYTDTLGFVKKIDMPTGEYRWLTVVSPGGRDGTEVRPEAEAHRGAR